MKSWQPRHWNYLIPKQNDQKTLPMHRNWPITADSVSWVLQAMTIIFSNQILILTNYDSFYNDDFCSGCTKANFSYPLVDNRATWVRAREITEILKIPKSLIAENVFLLVFILAQCRPEEVSSKHGPIPSPAFPHLRLCTADQPKHSAILCPS